MSDVKRVYEIEVKGIEAGQQELAKLTASFDVLDAQFKELIKTLAGKEAAGADSNVIATLTKQKQELEKQIDSLTKHILAQQKELTLLTTEQKKNAEIDLINAKTKKQLADADLSVIKATQLQTGESKKQTQQSKENADAAEEEEQRYVTLAEQIAILKKAREQAKVENTDIVTVGEDKFTLDEIAQKIKELTLLQQDLKKEVTLTKQQRDSENFSTQKGISLIAQQRRELEAVLNSRPEGSEIFFDKRILSYEEATKKLIKLRNAEDAEIANQQRIKAETETTTTTIEQLTDREEKLSAAIASAKKTTISPFSPQLGVQFEDNTITLRQAETLQESITAEKQKQQQILTGLNAEQASINLKSQEEEAIRKATLLAEEGSLNNLKAQSAELTKQIDQRNAGSKTPITFGEDTLTLDEAIAKRKEINDLIEKRKQETSGVIEVEQKEVSQLDQLIAKRKEIETLVINAQRQGQQTFQVEGPTGQLTISVQQGIQAVKEMRVEEQRLIDQFKVETTIHDANNIAQQKSITLIRQEAAELQQALANRAQGAQTLTFRGNTQDIDFFQQRLAVLQGQVNSYTEAEKLRVQQLNIVSNSMKELALETQQLSKLVPQLTVANKELGLNLNQQQWNQLRVTLIELAPEIANLSLAEVNAGKAGDLLKQKIFENNAALRDFRREISGSNTVVGDYTKGIVDAFRNLGLGQILGKERADVNTQIQQIVVKINELNQDWKNAFATGAGGLDKIEAELRQTAQLHDQLTNKARVLNTTLNDTGTIGNNITKSIENGFKNLDTTVGRTVVTYIGLQAAISGIQNAIHIDKTLTDQFADLQRIMGSTRQATEGVIDKLKELDTRTSLTQLQGFAIIAARAGVASDKIAGVTSAINKLQLTAGSELGDIDTAITSIVKLINIFQGAGSVSEESVLKLGNAIVTLSNQGVASGRFLVNFSERLAGIEGATHIAMESVFGLSAAFEETGQTAEIAATSVAQVLNKISQNIPKFAELANKPTEEFRKLLQQNPAEALLTLSENLVKEGATIDEIGVKFKELGLTGVRIKNTFQDMGANAEFFRKRIADATNALLDQNTILVGAANKQETFAATIDKIGAEFTKVINNRGFVELLDNISRAALFLIQTLSKIPFAAIATVITATTAAWAVYKGQVIAAALAQETFTKNTILGGIARLAERVGLINVTAAQKAKNLALQQEAELQRITAIERIRATAATAEEAEATIAATFANDALNTSLKLSPLGVILGILGLIIPLWGLFASKADDATASIERQNKALKGTAQIQADIHKSIQEETLKTQNRVQALVKIIQDENLNINLRHDAYNRLIAIESTFNNTVDFTIDKLGNEKATIINLIQVYDNFIAKIQEAARARAVGALTSKSADEVATTSLKVEAAEAVLIDKQKQQQLVKNEQDKLRQINAERAKQGLPTLIAGAEFVPEDTKLTPAIAKQLGINLDLLLSAKKTQKEINDATKAIADAKAENATAVQQQRINAEVVNKELQLLTNKLDAVNEELAKSNISKERRLELEKQKASLNEQIRVEMNISVPTVPEDESPTIESLKAQLKDVQDQERLQDGIIIALEERKKKGENVSVKLAEANLQLDELNKQEARLKNQLKDFNIPGKQPSAATGRAQDERDVFNEIETIRARDVAQENLRVAKIQEIRKLELEETEQHLHNLQEINDTADNAKIQQLQTVLNTTIEMEKTASGKKLDNLKSDAIREEKEIAEAELSIATRRLQTAEQITAARQKTLNEEIRQEKKDLEARTQELQLQFEKIEEIPNVLPSVVAKAQAKMHADIIAETKQHYDTMIALAQKFGLSTEQLEDERDKAITKALRDSLNDERDIYDSFFKDVEKKMTDNILSIQDKLNSLREAVLNSGESDAQKNFKLDLIDKIQTAKQAIEQVKDLTEEFKKAQKDFDHAFDDTRRPGENIFITQEDLDKLHDRLVAAKVDLQQTLSDLNSGINDFSSVKGAFASGIGNLFKGTFKITQEDLDNLDELNKKIGLQQLLVETIADTFQTAQQVMNDFFQVEKNNIAASTKAGEARLQTELDQQKRRAQSQAEQDSLERQFAAKKKALDQDAFEKNKKLQLEQAKISFATELINLAVIATAPTPANLFSLGVAGQIMFGIQAALALIRYISTVNQIKSAQFTGEFGLSADRDTIRGGRVKGRPHSRGGNPFLFKGRVFEDEVDEINVIRTKDAPRGKKYQIAGTQEQIASMLNAIGGGIHWNPGAAIKVLSYGGSIKPSGRFDAGGSVLSLGAPSNPAQILLSKSNDDEWKKAVIEVSNRIAELGDKVDQQTENVNDFAFTVNKRIDNIKVINVASETEQVNKNQKKASNIGTIR